MATIESLTQRSSIIFLTKKYNPMVLVGQTHTIRMLSLKDISIQ